MKTIHLLTAAVLASAGAAADLPSGPGKEATVRVCGKCHAPELATSQRLTRDQWQATISKMANLGAQASDNEFEAILNYLSANFGPQAAQPVNVNKATAVEIECVLGLTRTESRAIVQYRQQHGPLTALDDFSRIPGVDSKKIMAEKSLVAF
jgi:competence protein ComEA